MIDHSASLILMDAARAAYGGIPIKDSTGFFLDIRLGNGGVFDDKEPAPDEQTGLRVHAYTNGEGEYIIAFAGTQDIQDWSANLNLGWSQ